MAFGIGVLATPEVTDKQLKHVVGVLAQFLDNNMDGKADTGVAEKMAKRNAVLLVTKDKA